MKPGDLVQHIDDILNPSRVPPIGIVIRVEYFDEARTGIYGSYIPQGEYASVAFTDYRPHEEWLTRDLKLLSLA